MKRLFLFCILALGYNAISQNLKVSEEILDELKTVTLHTELDTFTLQVKYPKGYNPEQSYNVFLGLSGGDQSLKVVNYCYAAWFRSGYFNDYITIMPVVDRDTINFKSFKNEEVEDLLNGISKEFNTKPNWLIAGTSNGGEAALNFVEVDPYRFAGVIVAPGKLGDKIIPTETWQHLKVIFAYGEKDDKEWYASAKEDVKRLKKKVKEVHLIKMEGQGHILTIAYNADKLYDAYFLKK